MNYKELWGSPHPGHIIYLLDMSGSMYNQDFGCRINHAVESIELGISDILAKCYNSDTGKVSKRCWITVIGYGCEEGIEGVKILRKGMVDSWENDILKNQNEGTPLFEIGTDGYWTPMAEAFRLAEKCLLKTREKIREEMDNPNPNREKAIMGVGEPVVVNVTDGRIIDFELIDGYAEEVRKAAEDLMNAYQDEGGHVHLFNAHFGNGKKNLLPSDKGALEGDPEAEFLFDISSKLTEDGVKAAKRIWTKDGLKIMADCRGYVANADTDTVEKLIRYGSTIA